MSIERRDMIRRLLGLTWVSMLVTSVVVAIILVLVYAVPVLSKYFETDRMYRACVAANPTTPDKWLEMMLTCREASEEFSK